MMKYTVKMQVHVNVCVNQKSVIFLLKIKDYFSSNKDETTFLMDYIHLQIYYLFISDKKLCLYHIPLKYFDPLKESQ